MFALVQCDLVSYKLECFLLAWGHFNEWRVHRVVLGESDSSACAHAVLIWVSCGIVIFKLLSVRRVA